MGRSLPVGNGRLGAMVFGNAAEERIQLSEETYWSGGPYSTVVKDLWRNQNRFNEFINWEKVNRYRFFGGIRNEEDFVMTENGPLLLGKQKPKTLDEIEAIRMEIV